MQYTEQHTPPYKSSSQTHTPRKSPLLESLWPSPSRHGPIPRYTQNLRLYSFNHQVPKTPPPSPSPSESWLCHVSNGASLLMTQETADSFASGPFASGAFDHPINQPQPLGNSHLLHRSLVSSVATATVYSHPGPDDACHGMNREMATVSLGSHGWSHDMHYVQTEASLPSSRHHTLTVAPEGLNGTMFPHGNHYGATQLPRMEPTPAPEYEYQAYLRVSREKSSASCTEYPQMSVHRQRLRSRRHTSPSTAAFDCYQCKNPKGFARHYNYKQHMETHKLDRARPNVCPYEGCRKAFVRGTDLKRHHISVHAKRKDYKCDRCPALFARKDTCVRHMTDGCPQKEQLSSSQVYRQGDCYTARL